MLCIHLITETCQSGEELSDVGCVPCARGYYRDEQESRTCLPCPAGKITVDVGATSSTQCTVGKSHHNLSRPEGKPTMRFPNRSDT